MIKDTDVVKDLKLLVELIESGEVQVTGYGIKRNFEQQEPEFADFENESQLQIVDTGRRTLNLEFIE